ncbi:helix-turn-helix domain-containing protein [Methylomagnum ishizawai]|uniref:helix-turn-helix domain-containing protein n=1 Tax=Methylomagnum ishizawai TaxID=1760988 RepID=UPI001C335DD1|nr:helix-turn-helix domain-containing protein [Methylomagnum ishizawai]BBL75910.1 anaerobic regulatory protein [Methylomagnum ishizawai]
MSAKPPFRPGTTPKITCDECRLSKLCIPKGLTQEEVNSLSRIVRRNRTLGKGTVLYQHGEWHHGILALKTGTVKLVSLDRQGNEYVVDFLLPGDILGFDGFSTQRHTCSAIALETVSYCEIPAHQIDILTREIPGLLQVLLQHSGNQFELGVQRLILSRRSAEERLASFLAHLSERYRQRGFSPLEFRFSMTRQEIGNYLGLAPETISRLLGQFEAAGLVEVQSKLIRILDMPGLLSFCGQ